MALPTTRAQFKEHVLRALGKPVIMVNLHDQQIEDEIDDVLQFMQDFHWDFSRKDYIAHQLTQTEVDNQAIEINDSSIQVVAMWKPFGPNITNTNALFSFDYHMRINDLWNISTGTISGYVIGRQYIELLNDILNQTPRIRHRKYEGKVYLDMGPDRLTVGEYIILEVWKDLNGTDNPDIWKNRKFRELVEAKCRLRWGRNMSKFQNVQLPGGVTMNGAEMVADAKEEIARLEDDFILKNQEPDGGYIA